MPDLSELLHDAAPPHAGFDAEDVRQRVAAADRARRRTSVGLMASVVLLAAIVVWTGQRGGSETGLVDQAGVEGWPASVSFLGAEVEVDRSGALPQLTGYVEPGDTVTQVGVGGIEDGQVELWFTCGDDGVVGIREAVAEGSTPVLPVGALAEVVTQVTTATGCVPDQPDGTPDILLDGGSYLAGLARAMHAANLTACCAMVDVSPMADRPGVSGASIGGFSQPEGSVRWGVLDDESQPLEFTVDFLTWTPSGFVQPSAVALAGGQVIVDDQVGGLVANTCGMATLQARLGATDLSRWATFLDAIGCTPEPPSGFAPSRSLLALLRQMDLEATVIPSPDPTVGAARVVIDGIELIVRSGGMSQVGLPTSVFGGNQGRTGTFEGVGPGWPPQSSLMPIGGAYAVCVVTHAIFANDEMGMDQALSLAEALVADPGCNTDADGGPPGPPPPTTDPTAQPTGDTAAADPIRSALEAAGTRVTDVEREGSRTRLSYLPRQAEPGAEPPPINVWIHDPDVDPGWAISGRTPLRTLAEGEAAEIAEFDGAAGVAVQAFHCDGVGALTVAPRFGVAEDYMTPESASPIKTAWLAQLPEAIGCQPRPPGVTTAFTADDGTPIARFESIREARVQAALADLAVEQCCGEPSHGGSGAATGMVWEGVEVYIWAFKPLYATDEAIVSNVISVAGGQMDLGDGDGLPIASFDCDDTNYQLTHDSNNDRVQVRAAEALVEALGCVPRVGPA